MKRFEEQRRHQRRASTVEMNPEFEQKLGRFKPPAISDDDLKIMTIQRNAALLMREHPSLKRILKNHDFDRDLPDADRLHQVAMLFETGGLGIRKSPKDALRFHKFAAVLGHHRSQGVMGEYYETGTTEQRNPRRARALYRESSRASDSRAQHDLEPRKGEKLQRGCAQKKHRRFERWSLVQKKRPRSKRSGASYLFPAQVQPRPRLLPRAPRPAREPAQRTPALREGREAAREVRPGRAGLHVREGRGPAPETTSGMDTSNRSGFGCFLDGSCSLGAPVPESQTLVSKLFDKQHIDVGLHIFVSRPGEGDLKTDYNHAKRYYGMAANQGCERSAFNLGHLFEKGLVITENDVVRYALAKQWYERAEALGYARAEQRIAHIATLDAASPEPTVEEKKKEPDSDVDEMMDSDNDGDDENEPGAGRGSEGASILGSLNIR